MCCCIHACLDFNFLNVFSPYEQINHPFQTRGCDKVLNSFKPTSIDLYMVCWCQLTTKSLLSWSYNTTMFCFAERSIGNWQLFPYSFRFGWQPIWRGRRSIALPLMSIAFRARWIGVVCVSFVVVLFYCPAGRCCRRHDVTASVIVAPQETLIIFDWDDTVMPSSWDAQQHLFGYVWVQTSKNNMWVARDFSEHELRYTTCLSCQYELVLKVCCGHVMTCNDM